MSFVGDVNGWQATGLDRHRDTGLWAGSVPGAEHGQAYKLEIVGADGATVQHADPFAVHTETRPVNAFKLWDLTYDWGDDAWMASRVGAGGVAEPSWVTVVGP